MSIVFSPQSILLLLPFLVFSVGFFCIFLRRVALWCVIGQIVALKAAVTGAFLASAFNETGRGDLMLISLILLSLLPQACLVGLVVIHRCARFGGSLDMAKQGELKH